MIGNTNALNADIFHHVKPFTVQLAVHGWTERGTAMRLIDADVLKADYGMADDCKDCKTGYRSCEYDRIYSKMDFCGWLDDVPTVDAVPVVRCAVCRYFRCNMRGDGTLLNGVDEFECVLGRGGYDPMDFCSEGERKDGGNG